ncbi:unnamed protein product [Oppiella nova]|uniref:Uncharacterized protein n=1 Tax=Oppiella nova TaxID=334625 RepID=A0A7R9LI99_9ACAR|nr:unnamed protein product [Oppiella nova]CAG2163798.1 unnamed protein product [Oppiella nova]
MAYIKRDPFPISGLIKSNKDKIQTNLDDFSNAKVESKFHELKHELNINDDYSIKQNEFKEKVFPRLSELLSTTSALMLLQLILYNDYKIQKSQLIKSALKASLVPQLLIKQGPCCKCYQWLDHKCSLLTQSVVTSRHRHRELIARMSYQVINFLTEIVVQMIDLRFTEEVVTLVTSICGHYL